MTSSAPSPHARTLVRVTAGIIARNGKILIAQRHAADRSAGLWEFPGGKIETGETPEACLARELREELTMTVVVGERLGTSIYDDGHRTIELTAFRVFWDGRSIRAAIHQDCRWVPPERLTDFAFTPADRYFVRRLIRGEISLS